MDTPTIDFNFSNKMEATEPVLDSLESMEGTEVKTNLALRNGGSGETVGDHITDTTLQRAHIYKLLQEKMPWQSETVPIIASALVDSKSAKQSNTTRLFVQGNDSIGKTRLPFAVAESVFGSTHMLLHLEMLKKRGTLSTPFSEMLTEAFKTHQKLVVLIETIAFGDAQFKKLLFEGFETRKFGNLDSTTERNLNQVIFILTSGGSTSGGSTSIEEHNQELVEVLVAEIVGSDHILQPLVKIGTNQVLGNSGSGLGKVMQNLDNGKSMQNGGTNPVFGNSNYSKAMQNFDNGKAIQNRGINQAFGNSDSRHSMLGNFATSRLD
ncbi:hypothetical protein RJT34_16503 [Clitoria ternatea]|uniref:Uncharacterized protein n=1 Tax=Clitoria ternatea TaxID=43366 RepID=A0AAN9PCX3_CLITE